jgi:hypothetical protein
MRHLFRACALAALAALGALLLTSALKSHAAPSAHHFAGATQFVPNWQWNFAAAGAVPSPSTYGGASGRYCPNASGVFVLLSANTPCLTHDPSGTAIGYRSEAPSTNLLKWSGGIDNAAWNKFSGTVTADQATGPFGTATMDLFTAANASSEHQLTQGITAAANSFIGVSVFVRAGTLSRVFVNLGGSAGHYVTVKFDVSAGTIVSTQTGTNSGTLASTLLQNMGGGLWRVGIVASIAQANPFVVTGTCSPTGADSTDAWGVPIYSDPGTGTAYFEGLQAEAGGIGITGPIVTTSSPVTRAQDFLSMPLTSLPAWSSSAGGVVAALFQLFTTYPSSPGYEQTPVAISDGTFANRYDLSAAYNTGDGKQHGVMASGGANIAGAAQVVPFTTRKLALGFSATHMALAYDGTLDGTASGSYTLPTVTTLQLGGISNQSFGGALAWVGYWSGARPDLFTTWASHR